MKAAARTIGSWLVAGFILWVTLGLITAGASHGPDPLKGPKPKDLDCIKVVEVLNEIRYGVPDKEFKAEVLFRYSEARYFAKTSGWDPSAKTFYYIISNHGEWMILAADKNKCLITVDGRKAQFRKDVGQTFTGVLTGRGVNRLFEMQDYVRKQASYQEPTV